MSFPVVLTVPLFLLWKVLFPVAILVILGLKHWSPPSSPALSAAFSVFQTLGMRCVSAAAHGAFLGGTQQWRAFKEAEECFGSPSLPHIHPAGSWWVPTFHSHASFLPGDEMCMEVSVRVQLTVLLRPAVLLLHFPVHCLVTNAGFILVKWKRCRFVIFNIILTRNSAAALMLSEWALIDVFARFSVESLLISLEIDVMWTGIITETIASHSANASVIWISFIRHQGRTDALMRFAENEGRKLLCKATVEWRGLNVYSSQKLCEMGWKCWFVVVSVSSLIYSHGDILIYEPKFSLPSHLSKWSTL